MTYSAAAAAVAARGAVIVLCHLRFLQGVPVRVELGPRDISKGTMVMVRRDNGTKASANLEDAAESLKKLLGDIHEAMFAKYVDSSVFVKNLSLFLQLRSEPAYDRH